MPKFLKVDVVKKDKNDAESLLKGVFVNLDVVTAITKLDDKTHVFELVNNKMMLVRGFKGDML